jgi:hypothetical protein
MLFALAGAVILISFTYVLREVVSVVQNVRTCRRYNIPTVIVPVDPLTILGQVLGDPLYALLCYLPPRLQPACTPYLRRGWNFFEKNKPYTRMGPVWALVSPKDVHVQTGDPRAVFEVLDRRDRGQAGGGFVRYTPNYGQSSSCQYVQNVLC